MQAIFCGFENISFANRIRSLKLISAVYLRSSFLTAAVPYWKSMDMWIDFSRNTQEISCFLPSACTGASEVLPAEKKLYWITPLATNKKNFI